MKLTLRAPGDSADTTAPSTTKKRGEGNKN
jgi:hypothetical protein